MCGPCWLVNRLVPPAPVRSYQMSQQLSRGSGGGQPTGSAKHRQPWHTAMLQDLGEKAMGRMGQPHAAWRCVEIYGRACYSILRPIEYLMPAVAATAIHW